MEAIRLLLPLWICLGIMNIVTFVVYAADKRIAQSRKGIRRVPERTLLLLSFLGGCVGATLGMWLVRHKTKHTRFVILVPLSLVLWIAAVVVLVILVQRAL